MDLYLKVRHAHFEEGGWKADFWASRDTCRSEKRWGDRVLHVIAGPESDQKPETDKKDQLRIRSLLRCRFYI